MTSQSGSLRLNIQFGCTTEYPNRSQEFLRWKYSPKRSLIIETDEVLIYGDVHCVLEAKLQDDQKLPKWNQVSHYHSDNVTFISEAYHKGCEGKGQTQSFQALELSIKILGQSVPYKQLCIWLGWN